jgi:hypothetical protein
MRPSISRSTVSLFLSSTPTRQKITSIEGILHSETQFYLPLEQELVAVIDAEPSRTVLRCLRSTPKLLRCHDIALVYELFEVSVQRCIGTHAIFMFHIIGR